jgi:indole-3-acetate monooxygenase
LTTAEDITIDTEGPASDGVPATFEEILRAARDLSPWLRDRSDAIEANRRLPAEVVSRLRRAGAFRMAMPRSWGGPELTSMQQLEVIEEYAKADASVAWCVMIGCDSGLYSGWLDDDVARAMYPRLDMVQAGWIYPIGSARRVDGGYLVNGRWAFGSGSQHADWIAGGCWVHGEDESFESVAKRGSTRAWRIMLMSPQEIECLDTWYTTGLCGTGSTDYQATDVFVPAEHTFSFLEPARRPGTLYAGHEAFLRKMSGVPLGVARQALDEATAMLETKVDRVYNVPYRSMPRVQHCLGRCEAEWGAARRYVYGSVEDVWARLEAGEVPTKQERAHRWLARTNAFQSARSIVRQLYDVMGSSAVYRGRSRFDRYLRDTETMCQHVVGQTQGFELVGHLLLDPTDVGANLMI